VSALSVVGSACDSSAEDTTTTFDVEALTTSTAAAVDSSGPTLVIVDYSPTVSDVGGLMYLLAHPDVEVIAISLPVTGEAGCDLGLEVTLGILSMFGQEGIPVACDPETPGHARPWPPEFLEGNQNLSSGLPVSTVLVAEERASDMIARTAKEAGRPVVIYAVAPLTNVARAFDDHPDLADDVERLVIMGGAVNVPGNVEGANAEWNLWVDVPAAAAVIGSGVPVTLVPLDATNFVPIPGSYQRALSEANQSDAIVYLNRMVGVFPAVTSGFFFMWDELAATVAAGETYTTTKEMSIVVVEGGPDDGKTASGEGNPVTVAITVEDPDAFYADFLSTLARSR
jgi:inosine-uridine nucleoside N-ribohydrolase